MKKDSFVPITQCANYANVTAQHAQVAEKGTQRYVHQDRFLRAWDRVQPDMRDDDKRPQSNLTR